VSERWPQPVVGVVCFRGDEVLLIRRGNAPRLGEWSVPGGRMEWGETLHAAALRELHEETAVTADLLELVGVYDGVFPQDDRHFVLIDYAARWTGGEPVAGDDAADARFWPVEAAIEAVAWAPTKHLIRAAWEQFGGR